jgi:putative PIN family toxin of toxin-antitoxin system
MLDANILIAGVVWPRWPYEVVQHALRGDFHVVLSNYIIQQATRRFRMRFPAYLDRFDELMQTCQYELVPDPTRAQVDRNMDLVRDPSDVPLALAAINAEVDYLVSEDKDLTVQDRTTARMRHRLTVMISGTFLRQVMGWSSEELERIRQRNWRDIEAIDEP